MRIISNRLSCKDLQLDLYPKNTKRCGVTIKEKGPCHPISLNYYLSYLKITIEK